MLITGISLAEFKTIVEDVSGDYDNNLTVDPNTTELSGNRFRARTRVLSSFGAGARRGQSGRRGPYACWHTTRDVLTEVFILNSEARVQTALTTYRGRADFEAMFPFTAYHNVGSLVAPKHIHTLCECAS